MVISWKATVLRVKISERKVRPTLDGHSTTKSGSTLAWHKRECFPVQARRAWGNTLKWAYTGCRSDNTSLMSNWCWLIVRRHKLITISPVVVAENYENRATPLISKNPFKARRNLSWLNASHSNLLPPSLTHSHTLSLSQAPPCTLSSLHTPLRHPKA